ncbi:MAG: hypothetical protein R3F37_22435 [Candidatus Competibacteraceae bacterium]
MSHPPGWDYEPLRKRWPSATIVETGIWPLKEYSAGKVTHTVIPRPRLPVERYLERGRFKHLFSPQRNESVLKAIQARVDAYWD